MRQMSNIESAWVGAMIEGEGSVTECKSGNGQVYPRLVVYNTEVETISTILRLTGGGAVYYDGRNNQTHLKPCWRWCLTGTKKVVEVLEQIQPYLSGKQDEAKRLLDTYAT